MSLEYLSDVIAAIRGESYVEPLARVRIETGEEVRACRQIVQAALVLKALYGEMETAGSNHDIRITSCLTEISRFMMFLENQMENNQ